MYDHLKFIQCKFLDVANPSKEKLLAMAEADVVWVDTSNKFYLKTGLIGPLPNHKVSGVYYIIKTGDEVTFEEVVVLMTKVD